MAQYNLAARSRRHLRFARRMTLGQPLLARASNSSNDSNSSGSYLPPAYGSFASQQLPMGRILRRLPQSDPFLTDRVKARATPGDFPADDAQAPGAGTILRLLERLPELEAPAGTDASTPVDTAASQPYATNDAAPISPAQPAPPFVDEPPRTPLPMRLTAQRPRSRIVELPGIVSLPAADEVGENGADETGSTPELQTSKEANADGEAGVEAGLEERAADTQAEGLEGVAGPDVLDGPVTQAPTPDESSAVAAGESTPSVSAEAAEAPTPPTPPAPRRRGGRRVAPPALRASDALFPPTDADRSPQTWLSRLQQAAKPTQPTQSSPSVVSTPPAPFAPKGSRAGSRGQAKGGQAKGDQAPATPPTAVTPPTTDEQPTVLSDTSRATLRTLTGVDPASVRIYRGPLAERVTAAQHADALTDGAAIALGAGHALDAPETLGLLAHELTHVAHRRNPRFVPPVARDVLGQPRGAVPPQAQEPLTSAQPAVSPMDEETQATWVEARVAHLASAQGAFPVAAQPVPPPMSEPPQQPGVERQSREAYSRSGGPDIWGNLPAPWEPLPEWLTVTPNASIPSAPSSRPSQPSQPVQPTQPIQTTSQPAAPGHSSSAAAPGVQRAEVGRSAPSGAPEAAHRASPREGAAPEPDLDALAQQVHAILKRRLAAERRRFG